MILTRRRDNHREARVLESSEGTAFVALKVEGRATATEHRKVRATGSLLEPQLYSLKCLSRASKTAENQ